MSLGAIFDEVQATLLNSECSPGYAVERALLAVVQFAHVEAGMDKADVAKLLELTEKDGLRNELWWEDDA